MSDRLKELFAEVAPTYERVNHILTFGLDRLWRRPAARWGARSGGRLWLDVCSGSGDMARALLRRASGETRVVAVDFCLPMLKQAVGSGQALRPLAVGGNVRGLPFPEATFDLVTISFATRNINLSRSVLEDTFREFRRVLKPGGVFINVETSQPRSRLVRSLFHVYVKAAVKPIGSRISGSQPGYAYLASTIPRFYRPEELARILEGAGFSGISWRPLFWGAAAIHRGIKP
ncbi:MAG: ubiquinone/menaquinone biosynthesis methyltransferase [Candidatus Aminicenantes bacterium]|nr:ubiquinone/menaquinone biosynthesis methyltransferase [Candidatus Aminicenantes bacterium]